MNGQTTTYLEKAPSTDWLRLSTKWLNGAAYAWFVVAVIGQWIFAAYVAAFYGGSTLRGDLEAWAKVLPHGMIEGDAMGNVALAGHLLFAFLIMVGGPLQFVPQVRKRFINFHRWNGRVYLTAVFIASISGLYIILTRGTVGSLTMSLGTSFNAVLIMIFSVVALRLVLKGRIKAHERWAFRLFLVVSGVWFFRIGLMFWIMINGGKAVGFDGETFTGPFLDLWSYGQYLLPLAIAELYFMAQDSKVPWKKMAMGGGLVLAIVATGMGIFVATMGMWLPRM